MEHPVIRLAVRSDAAQINALFIQMMQSIYPQKEATGYDDGYLDKYFESDEHWIHVVESDGRMIAFLSIDFHTEEDVPFLYLNDLSVAPDCRGGGIGSSLLSLAEEDAMLHQCNQLFLHVETSNVRAQKLYRSFGYEKVGMDGTRIKMRKLLS